MNIGEASVQSQVSSKTIRRYEDLGIIPRASRGDSGYRKYTEKDVHILRFVKRARELGFSMKDIKELVGLWRNKSRSSGQVRKIAQRHQTELQSKLKEIKSMLNTLNHLVDCCHGDERPDCPILEELEGHAPK